MELKTLNTFGATIYKIFLNEDYVEAKIVYSESLENIIILIIKSFTIFIEETM